MGNATTNRKQKFFFLFYPCFMYILCLLNLFHRYLFPIFSTFFLLYSYLCIFYITHFISSHMQRKLWAARNRLCPRTNTHVSKHTSVSYGHYCVQYPLNIFVAHGPKCLTFELTIYRVWGCSLFRIIQGIINIYSIWQQVWKTMHYRVVHSEWDIRQLLEECKLQSLIIWLMNLN